MDKRKILFLFIIICMIGVLFYLVGSTSLKEYLTLDYLKAKREVLHEYYVHNRLWVIGIYFVIYLLVATLAIPVADIITIAGGAIFGVWLGTVIVSFASTIGATFCFLLSRWLLGNYFWKVFKRAFESINAGVQKEGAFYLFALRLVPIFPFFLINPVMGLTKMRTSVFFFVSQLGMLPGTLVHVNVGSQLASIESLKGLLSWKIIVSLSLLGIVPLVSKWVIDYIRRHRA